jgi:hypothetical protein
MKRHLTFEQYRRMDLFFFAVMLCVSEALIVNAAIRWFPDQLYSVSVTAALTAIVLVRWGPWAAIHAVLGGLVYCAAGGGSGKQFLIYGLGNLLSLLSLGLIRLFGSERIRKNPLLTLLYALCTLLLMQLGRALLALVLGAQLKTCFDFFTTDALSGLFTMVILWIAARLDGILEDQKTYLLRVNKEREEEKGGF